MWEKRKVWVITAFLADEDEDGEDMGWSEPLVEYYADTYEEALEKQEQLLSGMDEFYGNLVEHCTISDEPEEREFLKRTE